MVLGRYCNEDMADMASTRATGSVCGGGGVGGGVGGGAGEVSYGVTRHAFYWHEVRSCCRVLVLLYSSALAGWQYPQWARAEAQQLDCTRWKRADASHSLNGPALLRCSYRRTSYPHSTLVVVEIGSIRIARPDVVHPTDSMHLPARLDTPRERHEVPAGPRSTQLT